MNITRDGLVKRGRNLPTAAVILLAITTSAPAQVGDGGTKADAERALQNYLAIWSSEKSFDATTVGRFYAPRVVYYGKNFSRAQVLGDKEAYARQWPVRLYREVPGSLAARCDAAKTLCKVSADMTWHRVSRARQGVRRACAPDVRFRAGRGRSQDRARVRPHPLASLLFIWLRRDPPVDARAREVNAWSEQACVGCPTLRPPRSLFGAEFDRKTGTAFPKLGLGLTSALAGRRTRRTVTRTAAAGRAAAVPAAAVLAWRPVLVLEGPRAVAPMTGVALTTPARRAARLAGWLLLSRLSLLDGCERRIGIATVLGGDRLARQLLDRAEERPLLAVAEGDRATLRPGARGAADTMDVGFRDVRQVRS